MKSKMNKLNFLKRACYFSLALIIVLNLSACEDEVVETPPDVVSSDLFVDLRPQQTPIRDQGARGTCITFSATAALEAAYKKIGYGSLDLSNEFMNHMGKTFWLHNNWDEILIKGNDGSEAQVAAFSGGNGAGYLFDMWQRGLKIPLNEVMPYRSTEYSSETDPTFADENWLAPIYRKQRNMSNFNLDSNKLSYEVLHADKYYGVGLAKIHSDEKSRDTDFIEQILKREIEVVWDFNGAIPSRQGSFDENNVWQPCSTCGMGAHSMLIVGFDKRDPDPAKHYFLVKNSWGDSWTGTDDGFTLISYDYVRQYGRTIAHIELPLLDPKPWEELKFIGRWQLVFDGHAGELDIYHLPGYFNLSDPWIERTVEDKRIGTFYDANGKAHKVNGSLEGNKITFYFDGANPDLRWDILSGRKFEYYLSDADYMSGFHTDADGSMYAGYARKAGRFSAGTSTPRPFLPTSYVNSTWELHMDMRSGTVELGDLEEYEGEFPENYNIYGTFSDEEGDVSNFHLQMPQTEYDHFNMQLLIDGDAVSMEGRHMNHAAGNIAGHTTGIEEKRPFVMIRK